MNDFLISPQYRVSVWTKLNLGDADSGDWTTAISIVEDRIRGRYVHWIDQIIGERFAGFAALALDCVFLEAMVGFQTGKACDGDKKTCRRFLTESRFFSPPFTPQLSESFHRDVRNGIAHDGETRNRWLVEMNWPKGKILEVVNGTIPNCQEVVLNRTEFHKALVSEFEEWLAAMRCGDTQVRKSMRGRMDGILNNHAQYRGGNPGAII